MWFQSPYQLAIHTGRHLHSTSHTLDHSNLHLPVISEPKQSHTQKKTMQRFIFQRINATN